METQTLNIADIRTDGGTQPRAELDAPTAAQYAEALADGAEFPPPVVYYDGDEYWLADGFHRLRAHEIADREEIAVEVRQGTQRDAVLHSAGANATHGLRRTREDKRRAVARLLEDAEWQQWSDREIARICNVGNRFVGDLRRALCPDTVGGPRKYTRAGHEQTMDTAAIGESKGGTYQVSTLPPGCPVQITLVSTRSDADCPAWRAGYTLSVRGAGTRSVAAAKGFDGDDEVRALARALRSAYSVLVTDFWQACPENRVGVFGAVLGWWRQQVWQRNDLEIGDTPFPAAWILGAYADAYMCEHDDMEVRVRDGQDVYRRLRQDWQHMQIGLDDGEDVARYLTDGVTRGDWVIMDARGGIVGDTGSIERRLVAGLANLLEDGILSTATADRLAEMPPDRQYAVFDCAVDNGVNEGQSVDWESIIQDIEWSAVEGRTTETGTAGTETCFGATDGDGPPDGHATGGRYDIFTGEEPPDEKQAEMRDWHARKKADSAERSRETGLALLLEEMRQLLEIEDDTMFGRAVLGTLALIAPKVGTPAPRHFAAQYPEEAPKEWANAEKLYDAGWTPVCISGDDPTVIEAYGPEGWWALLKGSSKTAVEKTYKSLTGTTSEWLPFINPDDPRKSLPHGMVMYRDRGDQGVWYHDREGDGWNKCTDGKSFSALTRYKHALEG